MTTNRWRVRHPGIGTIAYNSESEARIAAGTAGEMLAPAPAAARCTSQNNCLTVTHHGDGRVTIASTESGEHVDATAPEWAGRPAELGGPVPPDADIRALALDVVREGDHALGDGGECGRPDEQAAVVDAVLAHRAQALREMATELRRRASRLVGAGIAPGIMYAASVLTASATQPPTGPASGTVPAEQTLPVPEPTPAPEEGSRVTRYRVGRKLGRTLYRDDELIGLMDTAADAALVVNALNGDEPADVLGARVERDRLAATIQRYQPVIDAAQAWRAAGWNTHAGDLATALTATLAALDDAGPRTMTDAGEAALLARQRDTVLALCAAADPGIRMVPVDAIHNAYLHDPDDAGTRPDPALASMLRQVDFLCECRPDGKCEHNGRVGDEENDPALPSFGVVVGRGKLTRALLNRVVFGRIERALRRRYGIPETEEDTDA